MSIDRFQYGYDSASNIIFSLDVRAPGVPGSVDPNGQGLSQLYVPDGSSLNNGYDPQGRELSFEQGVLGHMGPGSNYNLISNPNPKLSWRVNGTANWQESNFNSNDHPTFQTNVIPRDSLYMGQSPPLGRTLFFEFDPWGNLAWSASSRLTVGVNNSGGEMGYRGTVQTTYQYDALGRRISDGSDLYYDASGHLIQETSGSTTYNDIYSPDGLLVVRIDQNGQTFYALQDAKDNVVAITNGNGGLVERYLYTPDGKATITNAAGITLSGSAYAWRTLFQQGRDNGDGLLYLGGQELNTTSGQPLVEDPHASQAANWAYSVYTAQNSEVSNTDPYHVAQAAGWVSAGAFTLATFGAYAGVLGFARGAAVYGGLAAAGGVGGGIYGYETGGSIAGDAFAGANIATGLGSISPTMAAWAAERLGSAALRVSTRAVDAGLSFGSGFAMGFSEPVATYLSTFGSGSIEGGVRVLNGMRAGLAEAGLRNLRFVTPLNPPKKWVFNLDAISCSR